jgi:hydroxymethylpyrimidine kinase/phosphomethylpyrimidine kinase/thiamine-phosphate diphosphorylase
VIGPGRLVGVSTHNLAEASAAVAAGADYVGLGAMFPTASKNVQSYASPQVVGEVLAGVSVPVFCIGGVAPENIGRLKDLGVKHVAAGASILCARDPAAAFKALADGLAE